MAEKKFKPKPGQINYTNARYAPVVNTVVTKNGKVLLVKRSDKLRLYPGYWNGISGFLDDRSSIVEKVKSELNEELGIKTVDVTDVKVGSPFIQEALEYSKTWLVVPCLAKVKTASYDLDWEAQSAKWLYPKEIAKLELLPGFENVIGQFFEL